MGRKITLFRFDVAPDADGRTEAADEHVTVERPADRADDGGDEEGGSLVRRLLVGALLLGVGTLGGFLFRGTAAGRNLASTVWSKLPFVGGGEPSDQADEPDYQERGASTLVGFTFLVGLTALSKRLYAAGPLDEPATE
ncbi:hypothetical protein ACFO0N_19435 [Halobium salinum]|uniref:DUF4235 domain-containing protein n=1 Tax=Halobium salinum TaxID=1364940 RepID=A0ABD5PHE0_9EURY|nr:hypothetical protein [Halobium salinum]